MIKGIKFHIVKKGFGEALVIFFLPQEREKVGRILNRRHGRASSPEFSSTNLVNMIM